MKKILITSSLLLITLIVLGQFFAEVGTGYAISINKKSFLYNNVKIVDDKVNNTYDKEYYSNKFSITQSPFVNITGGYKFNKLELSLCFSYLDNMIIKSSNPNNSFYTEENLIWDNEGDNSIFVHRQIKNKSFNTKGYFLSPEIYYEFKTEYFSVKPSMGVSFKFLNVYETYSISSATFIIDSSSNMPPSYATKNYKYKSELSFDLNNLIVLKPGIYLAYSANSNIEWSCKLTYNFSPLYSIKTKVQTLYELEFEGQVLETDNNHYYITSSELFNVNTLNFSIGVRYYFNNNNTSAKNE